MTDGDELLGLAEVAALLGVSKQAVANWRTRREDFPEPTAELKSGPIWNKDKIVEWASENNMQMHDAADAVANGRVLESPTVISVVNMKGGVGKSTVTVNLGWYCAYRKNMKVLLVDLDPQFNLSQYAMGTAGYEAHLNEGKGTVIQVFEQATPKAVSGVQRKTLKPKDVIAKVKAWSDGSRIDLIPSSLELSWTLKNPHQKEQLLSGFLEDVKSDYDLILIDCPPTDSMLTTAAYLSSDSVLVPVRPEFLSTVGLPLVVRSLQDFERFYKGRSVDVLGILFNAGSDKLEHDRSREHVRKVANSNKWHVFKHEISYSDSYPKGSRLGTPIFLTDYARSHKITDLYSVAEEFLARVNS
jgi:chromosome partitioning protein